MKKLNIFKAGRHISAAGSSLEFSEQDLADTVAAYNPETHEAPIVVGHPKDNNPAYGWVSGLSFSESTGLEANTSQVDPEFSEMVNAGRFKKISASFYAPDSPSNPVPGVYYLRHVGFLGAQPPAVKGLRDASFNESEQGVIVFADWSDVQSAGLWRKMREWIIGKDGVDEADKVLPAYIIEDLEAASREPDKEVPATLPINNFNEGNTMTPEQIAIMQAENAALKIKADETEAKSANFAEREARIAEQEAESVRLSNDSFIAGLVAAGKVLPAQKVGLSEFMQSLDETVEIEFKEGESEKKKPQAEFFKDYLNSMPKIIDYSEQSKDDGNEQEGGKSPQEVATLAVQYQEEQAAKGTEISISQAVAHISK